MDKRVIILAVPLLLIAGFIGLRAALDSGDGTDAARLPGQEALTPRAAAMDTFAEKEVAAGSTRIEAAEAARSVVAGADAKGDAFDLESAVWIEGRVAIPPGSPRDETLAVVAWPVAEGTTRSAEGTSRSGGASPPWWRERVEGVKGWSRVPVASDASFRVPLPEGTRRVTLLIDGRHLYMDAALDVDVAERAPVVLRPELGACLVLRCLPPAGAEEGGAELAGIELELAGAAGGGGMFGMGRGGVRRELELPADLVAEFRGLPADHTWFLSADPIVYESARLFDLKLESGRTLERELVFALGARFSGVVVDRQGAPVAGARVEARHEGQFARFAGGDTRFDTSDDEGRFEVRGVRARRLKLRANLEGWIGAETEELKPGAGEELRGLRLVLDRGLAIAGRLRFPDGSPATGARVTLTASDAAGGPFGGGRAPRGDADAQGLFEISGLDAGKSYDLLATAAAERPRAGFGSIEAALEVSPEDIFEEFTAPGSSAAEARRDRAGWRAQVQAVPAGTRGLELVLAEPPGLAGQVFDPDGLPLASYEVRARLRESELGRAGNASAKIEDDDGRFLLTSVFAGEWTITVTAPGLVTAQEELRVRVPQAGGELRIDMLRASGVAGLVLDPAGQPVAGAAVRLSQGRASARQQGMGMFQAGGLSAESDQEGHFAFVDIRPGTWTVRATSEEWAPSPETLLELLAGVETSNLMLTLSAGGTLTGEIYDANGKPESGRAIMTMTMGSGPGRSATSDGAGRFRIERLAPGQYTVMAQPQLSMLSELEERDEDPNPVDFISSMKMASAEIVEGGETHVVLGAPPKDPVRLYGRVTELGEPVGSGSVMVVAEGRSLLEAWKPARVQADGTYELVLDEPGNVLVTYQDRAFEGSGTEFYVRVPAGEEFRFDLELPTGSISGLVIGPDGGPLAGQRVSIERDSGLRGMTMMGGQNGETTDERGRFSFTRLQPASYTLRAGGGALPGAGAGVQGPRYGTRVVSGIELAPRGRVDDVRIRLERPGTLRGSVVGSDGLPVAGASIYVRDAEGRLLQALSNTTTDGEGRFRRAGLAPGAISVSARVGEEASAEVGPLEIREGDETEVQLSLAPGTVLRVAAEDSAGAPIRVSLSVTDERGREYATLRSFEDMQAMFSEGFSTTEQRIGPLPPGSYVITATSPEGESERRTLKLSGRAERKLRLRFGD